MAAFRRVRDRDTGHEFDVPDGDLGIGTVYDDITSDRWPVRRGHLIQPRPPLYHTDKAGNPTPPPSPPQPKPAPVNTNTKEA